MRTLLLRLRPADATQWAFVAFVAALVGGGALAGLRQTPLALAPALGAVGVLLALVNWRWLYLLLFALLPFSLEIGLPGGLSMDVPSEPLMLALTACVPVVLVLNRGRDLRWREWNHPLLALLLALLLWAALGIVFSVDKLKSAKYVLAKVWYLTPFVLGTLVLVRRPADFWRVVAVYISGVCLTVGWTLARHAAHGFSFASVNRALQPFYPNHVIYATTVALLLPPAWGLVRRASGVGARRAWRVAAGVLLLGLVLSYTRASWLSLPAAGAFYLVVRLRLTRWLLAGAAVGAAGAAVYLTQGANFMRYAPDFEHTIWNGNNFEKHLEATYNMQDVSGMERVYRWVAAGHMIAEKPLTGSGPATFYPEYKRYTVKSFRTYVSDNPEHSTTHNYFLLMLAEQGVPGFLLFCALLAVALLQAERLYHLSADRPEVRRVVLAVTLSLVIIVFHLLLNELVETDKIGSMFYVCLAMLIRSNTWLTVTADSTDF